VNPYKNEGVTIACKGLDLKKVKNKVLKSRYLIELPTVFSFTCKVELDGVKMQNQATRIL